jgi:hypothetical protein
MGDRWTMGVEIEADLPDSNIDATFPSAGYDLTPAVRMGIALRRHF